MVVKVIAKLKFLLKLGIFFFFEKLALDLFGGLSLDFPVLFQAGEFGRRLRSLPIQPAAELTCRPDIVGFFFIAEEKEGKKNVNRKPYKINIPKVILNIHGGHLLKEELP